jgi:NADPH2:quinone reductase
MSESESVQVVVATAFGGPEVLALIDAQPGEPGPGQALIAVRAVGVNPFDAKAYSGMMGADPASLPMHLGLEAAGVVIAVGEDAFGPNGRIGVGDEVIAYPITGAYAAQLVVSASSLTPKPAQLSWAQAAGLMAVGATAVHALTATGVKAGDTVLIHAASGGVGQAAVQVALASGARVIGTASAANQELVRALGATPVVYGPGLIDRVREVASSGVDAALDLIGNDEALDVSLELVADRSRVATIANFSRALGEGIKVLGGGPGADPGDDIRVAARLELLRLVSEGALDVSVERTYPLSDAAAAHRDISGGHSRGKLVLLP